MSSGFSGRYQSRFFNFVNKQSRRLTQHWGSTFRNLQVATKWGVEALLYPVYIFLQSTDSSVKKLYTKKPQSQHSLQPHDSDLLSETPLTTDRPIQRILDSVQQLASEETATTPKFRYFNILQLWRSQFFPLRTNQSNYSQSLATADKALPANTSQHNLPIVRGIASDLLSRQLILVSTENQILDILSPQQQAKLTDKIIIEVGEYWHDWQLIEAREQAYLLPEINRILAKLTGENIKELPVNTEMIAQKIFNRIRIINLLDAAIAQLEETAIIPARQRSLEIARVAQTQFSIFLYGKKQPNSTKEIVQNAKNLENQKQNVSALIEAALNYFFGVPKYNLLKSNSEQPLPDISYQSQQIYLTDDSWLDWSDLYGDCERNPQKILQSSKIKSHISSSNQRTEPQQKRASYKINSKNSQLQIHSEKQAENQPDWIDTEAIVLGYEKHLIEHILEWLDRLILWIEQILVNAFYFLQGLLQGK